MFYSPLCTLVQTEYSALSKVRREMLDQHVLLGPVQILATAFFLWLLSIVGVGAGFIRFPEREEKHWFVTVLGLVLISVLGVCFPFMDAVWKGKLLLIMFFFGVTMGLFGAKGPTTPHGKWLIARLERFWRSRR